MAKLPILQYPHPKLAAKAEPVADFNDAIKTLVNDMAETMYSADGVGLAAPQVAKSIRCVVIDVGDDNGLLELIDPVITEREGTDVDSEGCLSVPNVFGDVERSAKVVVEYTNRWNKRKRLAAGGLLARCIQHELDHLEGTLFIDVAKSLRNGDKKQ